MLRIWVRIALVSAPLALAGCGWLGLDGSSATKRLEGERISVLAFDRKIEADPRIANVDVRLPAAIANDIWPQPGGLPTRVIGQLALAETPRRAWSTDIGTGSSGQRRLTAAPVVAEGRIYTLDARTRVRAFLAATGEGLWEVDAAPPNDSESFGGGLAYDEGRLFVSTGFGQIVALDPATGSEVWRRQSASPFRAGPTAQGGLVFAISVENKIEAVDARNGELRWSHAGIAETASVLGGSSASSDGTIVVVPYSSGELFALRRDTGRVVWAESLAAVRRVDTVSTLADIKGLPVIDRGRVYAVSHSGRTIAIDLRSGARLWELEAGGTQTPWLAGDFLFLLTAGNDLLCVTLRDGRVRWVRSLPRYRNEERKRDPIFWVGPIAAGNALYVFNSRGEALAIAPETGETKATLDLGAAVRIPPIVANGALYVLAENGTLSAYR